MTIAVRAYCWANNRWVWVSFLPLQGNPCWSKTQIPMIRSLLVMLMMAVSITAFGQETIPSTVKVQKSTQKVKIGSKFYYIHIVQKGETLFSISKAYGVSQADIASENPDIYQGLKSDQALKIPALIIKEADLKGVTEDEDFIYHIVRKGETLSAIARLYEVSVGVLLKSNIDVENGVHESQVVVIPKKEVPVQVLQRDTVKQATQPADTADVISGNFLLHSVKAKETFYSLSKRYSVNLDTLIKTNADAQGVLKIGYTVRVPLAAVKVADVTTIATSSAGLSSDCACDSFKPANGNTVQIALALPFNAKGKSATPESASGKPTAEQHNFVSFYQGSLIALEMLRDSGFKIDLQVIDSKKDKEQLKRLSTSTNLIIGPAYASELKPVADYAQQRSVFMVSPLAMSPKIAETNPYFVQVWPSYNEQIEALADYVISNKEGNVILVYESGKDSSELVLRLKSRLSAAFPPSKVGEIITKRFFHISYRTAQPFDAIAGIFLKAFSKHTNNLVVVPVDNEAFVSDVLSKLANMRVVYSMPIQLYGLNEWQRYKSIDIENYYSLNLHYISPFFVDYAAANVKRFVTLYRSRFHAEPTQMAFHGYDVAYFFVPSVSQYGSSLDRCIPCHKESLLQSNYKFRRVGPNGGFENTGMFRVRFTPEYEIISE